MGEGRDTFSPLRRLLVLTKSITHGPCYQDSGSNLSREASPYTGCPLATARGMGGEKNDAALLWSQLQAPKTLLWKTMTRARHEMLIVVLLGYFVPEGEKICLVSKLLIFG